MDDDLRELMADVPDLYVARFAKLAELTGLRKTFAPDLGYHSLLGRLSTRPVARVIDCRAADVCHSGTAIA